MNDKSKELLQQAYVHAEDLSKHPLLLLESMFTCSKGQRLTWELRSVFGY